MASTLQRAIIPGARVSLYEPPAGYYDLPFMWVFDASALTDGSNAQNLSVPIYAGYGDFVLRRIVGMDRVLSSAPSVPGQVNPPGQFHLRDAIGRYLQQLPQYVGTGGAGSAIQNARDIAMSRDILYPENTQINFDLFDVARALDPSGTTHFSAQIGFHGVRRLQGASPFPASYRYRPKHYMYTISGVMTSPVAISGTSNATKPLRVIQRVQDFDFELHEIRMFYLTQASATFAGDQSITIIATPAGSAGNGITLTVSAAHLPNQVFSISVDTVGKVVTVVPATDGLGNITTTFAQLGQALNQNSAVQSLFTVIPNSSVSVIAPFTIVTAGGGGLEPSDICLSLLQLYDQNRVQVWSAPVVDLFVNRLSPDQNGAIVPPLVYRKDSVIEMDVYTVLNAVQVPFVIGIDYLGVQRIPC